MAFSNSKGVRNPLHHITTEGRLPAIKRPVIQVVRLKEETLQAPKTLNVSRRDALLYLTAETLGGIIVLSAVEPAEARVGRLDMKKKIMQKLEKLRENAGVSKTKTEERTNTPQAQPLPPLPPSMPFPNPQEGPIIESIIP
ncbi:hypothetical protein GH714_000106 [Hevea brasiliensis]|uniref:Uncharacterized protein n=1 Tax=Hevea brasiliensis TaxID=3981 RepID=A0A6A6M938_HEVBR|nr:hypothetical protein GH714_000106 [Hevea brasiliensis]